MNKKGVAGLPLLLSVVTLLFIIGMIIFVFALMGSGLQSSAPITITGDNGTVSEYVYDLYNTPSVPFNTTLWLHENVTVTNFQGGDFRYDYLGSGTLDFSPFPAGTTDFVNSMSLSAINLPALGTFSSITIENSDYWYLEVEDRVQNDPLVSYTFSYGGVEIYKQESSTEGYYFDGSPVDIAGLEINYDNGQYTYGFLNGTEIPFTPTDNIFKVTSYVRGNNITNRYSGVDIIIGDINITTLNSCEILNCGVGYVCSNDQCVAGSQAGIIIGDTTDSITGVTDWFAIILVITAMVVLILLTVLIINAIKRSGLVASA